ncbi:ATP-binding protein [Agrobacterium vitis]|uniref:AAA family ATPase n=1 Tax=Agrobacterium vitis TaxID=373 RepID=UPI001F414B4F|nr:AAA family ATPase [Agrobacterium vitis]
MNKHAFTSPPTGQFNAGSWERPLQAPEVSANKSEADIEKWWELVDRVIAVARQFRWTKAEVTRRSGMKDATFSQWFSGRYEGRLDNHNAMIEQWLDALQAAASVAAMIPQAPSFMQLRGSAEVLETLTWAQICPDLVMITLGAGMGKTAACEYFTNTRPHVYHATVSESTKTVHGMLTELAEQLGVQENNPARLARAIGGKLKRTGDGTLLIVDEGQHLNDEALNQLRHFVDVYRCGVAVVGNSEVYSRFTRGRQGPSYAQLKSRIGKGLKAVEFADDEDVIAFDDVVAQMRATSGFDMVLKAIRGMRDFIVAEKGADFADGLIPSLQIDSITETADLLRIADDIAPAPDATNYSAKKEDAMEEAALPVLNSGDE